jgi:hypothetical protein
VLASTPSRFDSEELRNPPLRIHSTLALIKIMTELIKTGKKRTILISISILLVSIYTIYFYHAVRPDIETTKLIQQGIRFLLTVGLLVLVYKGKKWAKIVSIVLFSLAVLGALVGLFTIDSESVINKLPLMVMIIVYSMAIYHFGISKSFKAFFDYKNGIKQNFNVEE